MGRGDRQQASQAHHLLYGQRSTRRSVSATPFIRLIEQLSDADLPTALTDYSSDLHLVEPLADRQLFDNQVEAKQARLSGFKGQGEAILDLYLFTNKGERFILFNWPDHQFGNAAERNLIRQLAEVTRPEKVNLLLRPTDKEQVNSLLYVYSNIKLTLDPSRGRVDERRDLLEIAQDKKIEEIYRRLFSSASSSQDVFQRNVGSRAFARALETGHELYFIRPLDMAEGRVSQAKSRPWLI